MVKNAMANCRTLYGEQDQTVQLLILEQKVYLRLVMHSCISKPVQVILALITFFFGFERTNFIQNTNETFYYNTFSFLADDPLI